MNYIGSRIAYYLILLPISWLPHFLLYRVSDFLKLIIFYIVPYRKDIVWSNLERSFPDKTVKELKAIRHQYYRHLCDLVLESVKNFSISNKTANERMKCLNPELPNSYFEKGKSIVFCGGHQNNWEMWAVCMNTQVKHQLLGIYKRIKDPFFEKVMYRTRAKFGLRLVSTTEVSPAMQAQDKELTASLFLFDQSPRDPKRAHWVHFLNQDTACYYGPEKYAREYDTPVLFGHIRKVKRGYYETWFEVVSDSPRSLKTGAIIDKIHGILEKDINSEPAHWLWSHRRWKHSRKKQ